MSQRRRLGLSSGVVVSVLLLGLAVPAAGQVRLSTIQEVVDGWKPEAHLYVLGFGLEARAGRLRRARGPALDVCGPVRLRSSARGCERSCAGTMPAGTAPGRGSPAPDSRPFRPDRGPDGRSSPSCSPARPTNGSMLMTRWLCKGVPGEPRPMAISPCARQGRRLAVRGTYERRCRLRSVGQKNEMPRSPGGAAPVASRRPRSPTSRSGLPLFWRALPIPREAWRGLNHTLASAGAPEKVEDRRRGVGVRSGARQARPTDRGRRSDGAKGLAEADPLKRLRRLRARGGPPRDRAMPRGVGRRKLYRTERGYATICIRFVIFSTQTRVPRAERGHPPATPRLLGYAAGGLGVARLVLTGADVRPEESEPPASPGSCSGRKGGSSASCNRGRRCRPCFDDGRFAERRELALSEFDVAR